MEKISEWEILKSGTKGDLLVSDGTEFKKLPIGTDGHVLTADDAEPDGLKWAVGGGGGAEIQTEIFTLSNAQIKALHTTPVTILTGVGAGKFFKFIAAQALLNYGGTNAFTTSSTNQLRITSIPGSLQYGTIPGSHFQTFIQSTSSVFSSFSPLNTVSSVQTMANYQSNILVETIEAVTGNAANNNTITIYLYYVEQDI
jgi:hypothetical protein